MKFILCGRNRAALSLLLMLALLFAGCGQQSREETLPETIPMQTTEEPVQTETGVTEPVQTEQTIPPETTEPTETAESPVQTNPEETEVPALAIETPYATLSYPGQWSEYLKVEQQELDLGLDVLFYGVISGQEHWLFTVHFGGADGFPVGAVQAPEGYLVDVTIELSDYVPDESWSEEDADLFCAMQEGMNQVSQSLREADGFAG